VSALNFPTRYRESCVNCVKLIYMYLTLYSIVKCLSYFYGYLTRQNNFCRNQRKKRLPGERKKGGRFYSTGIKFSLLKIAQENARESRRFGETGYKHRNLFNSRLIGHHIVPTSLTMLFSFFFLTYRKLLILSHITL